MNNKFVEVFVEVANMKGNAMTIILCSRLKKKLGRLERRFQRRTAAQRRCLSSK